MKILFVYAHPNPKSFANGILQKVVETAAVKKHQVVVRDLYALKFDPVLKGDDLAQIYSGKVPQDIKVEQEHIQWADVCVFVYPLWWTGLPAMLKGYIDRVYSFGFAYRYGSEGPEGLLKGKKALLFTNQGAPLGFYEANGMTNAIKQTSDAGIFNFCGIEVIGHHFFGGVPSSDAQTREAYLNSAEKAISSLV